MAEHGKRAQKGDGTERAIPVRSRPEQHMSYVEKVLQPGEKLRYQAAIHWVAYAHGVAWLIAAGLVWMVTPTAWRGGYVAEAAIFLLFCGAAFFLARALFKWGITEIAVTDRRVIYKRGFISRTTAEMHMDK